MNQKCFQSKNLDFPTRFYKFETFSMHAQSSSQWLPSLATPGGLPMTSYLMSKHNNLGDFPNTNWWGKIPHQLEIVWNFTAFKYILTCNFRARDSPRSREVDVGPCHVCGVTRSIPCLIWPRDSTFHGFTIQTQLPKAFYGTQSERKERTTHLGTVVRRSSYNIPSESKKRKLRSQCSLLYIRYSIL